jgi:hypothetical protein
MASQLDHRLDATTIVKKFTIGNKVNPDLSRSRIGSVDASSLQQAGSGGDSTIIETGTKTGGGSRLGLQRILAFARAQTALGIVFIK